MNNSTSTHAFYNACKKVGFPLPDECADVSVALPVTGVITMTYTVFLTPDKLDLLGKALELVAEANRP